MAQTLTVPAPVRFGRGYALSWGLAELGKSLVFAAFGALQKMQTDALVLHVAKHAMWNSRLNREGP